MNRLADWRNEAKSRVDLTAWAAALPGYRRGNPAKALCPFHAEKTPSMAVYKDHAFCFGACNKRYDIFDLLEQVEGLSREAATERVAQLSGLPLPTPEKATRAGGPPQSSTPHASIDLEQLLAHAREELLSGSSSLAEKARQYLLERRLATVSKTLHLGVITPQVARKAGLSAYLAQKFVGRLLIPYRHQGKTLTFTARALEGQEPKYDRPSGEIAAPFNADALGVARAQGCAVLCEGELDAAALLVAMGADAPIFGLPGGKLPKGWAEKLRGVTCYLAMDNDAAGRNHSLRLCEELSAAGVKVHALEWAGESAKDLNQLLVERGSAHLERWLENAMMEAGLPSDLRYVQEQFPGELEQRANRPAPAFATGLPSFDGILDGGFGEGLHVLGGITASGKTLLALQMAAHNAAAGRPVMFISYEQSKFELWARLAARITGLPITAFKKGCYALGERTYPMAAYLRQHHAEHLEQLAGLARCLRLVEGDAGSAQGEHRWTVSVIKAEAERQADAFGLAPLVILDYLQRMPPPAGGERRELRERVAMVASSLQVELARGLGCPVIAISSVNRASYQTGKNRAEDEELMSVFKEAGEVEYSAYTAMLLYKLGEKEAHQQNHAPTALTGAFDPFVLHLIKHREGRPGRVLLRRYGQRGVFEDRGEARLFES